MIFVRKVIHLATNFFGSTVVNNVLAELFVSYESVVDTQVILLFAILLELMGDVVFFVTWLLPVTVPVGSPFLDVVIGNREEIHGVLDKFLILLCSFFARSARTCNRQCRCPSMINILCTAFWLPCRVIRTFRCSQLHESFVLILDWRE